MSSLNNLEEVTDLAALFVEGNFCKCLASPALVLIVCKWVARCKNEYQLLMVAHRFTWLSF